MEDVAEDNGLKEFVDQDVPKSAASDVQNLVKWKKCLAKAKAKARQIMREGFRDHIVSNLHGKETSYAMWKALTDFY